LTELQLPSAPAFGGPAVSRGLLDRGAALEAALLFCWDGAGQE